MWVQVWEIRELRLGFRPKFSRLSLSSTETFVTSCLPVVSKVSKDKNNNKMC